MNNDNLNSIFGGIERKLNEYIHIAQETKQSALHRTKEWTKGRKR